MIVKTFSHGKDFPLIARSCSRGNKEFPLIVRTCSRGKDFPLIARTCSRGTSRSPKRETILSGAKEIFLKYLPTVKPHAVIQ